ncbi:MAG TPA: alpha/beta fold hydrolase [Candidatus Saccharimonadales bacterium]
MSDTIRPNQVVFLHGTGGDPGDHWWPWLRAEFAKSYYEVWAPVLPDNDKPNQETYWNFLMSRGVDFEDVVLVGHSSGATTVLNLLMDDRFPRVRAAVLVGVFLNQNLTSRREDFEKDQFVDLFPKNGFDWNVIKRKADNFYFVHGDDDPYCEYEDTVKASERLGGELITIKSGGHLTSRFGIVELPQLTAVLKHDGLLDENH